MKIAHKDLGKIKYESRVLLTHFRWDLFNKNDCPNCGEPIRLFTITGAGPRIVTNMTTGIHLCEYVCEECEYEYDHTWNLRGYDSITDRIKSFFRTPPLVQYTYDKLTTMRKFRVRDELIKPSWYNRLWGKI
jgi:hypothetical protein